jgi:hypothetical protein
VPADEIRTGWNVSPYIWSDSVSIQHELLPKVGLTLGYFRTVYGNLTATDNVLVTPADYSEYCATAPTDSRLPNGGGYPVCGLFDISRAKFGQVSNVVVNSDKFGTRTQVFDGIDFLVNARFGAGGLVSGGFSTGRTVTDDCAAPDFKPQFCRNTLPFAGQSEVKLSAVYPLPWWGVQVSGVYQNVPGIPVSATWVAPNSAIAPALGRNLAACPAATGACTATATIQLIEPGTAREDRNSQMDMRITKTFQLGRARIRGNFEVYNLFNSADVIIMNTTYSPTNSWLRPTSILAARLIKLGGQIDF